MKQCSVVSTCNISSLSPLHTGVYWCQSKSGERSKTVNITVHNGDVILDSPVHPVIEGNPLILRCLYRNKNISTGIDFYKHDSIIQNQTTGVMTISSVSKSDEGFYYCKHPEREESVKSWISVSVSPSGSSGAILGLCLAFVFVIIIIALILVLRYRKKKGVEYQPPSTVNQDTTQPAGAESIYANADIMTTAGPSNGNNPEVVTRKKKQNDDAARVPCDMKDLHIEMKNLKLHSKDAATEPSDLTYSEINMKKLKKAKGKQGKSSEEADTVYSELKQNPDKDAATGGCDVTYADIDLKKQKQKNKKQEKSTVEADTLYSELKQKTDEGNCPKVADTTYAQFMVKGKKNYADAATGGCDVTYADIDLKNSKKPNKKQVNAKSLEKSTAEADTLYSELKQKTDEVNCPKPADTTYAQVMVKGKKNNAEDVPTPADAIYAQVQVKSKRNNAGP